MRYFLPTAVVWGLVLLGPTPVGAQEAAAEAVPTREITQVRGDLYLVRDGQERTVFLVTPKGIILGDPLRRATALWLRDELAARFRQDVRVVVLTRHDYSRSEGWPVFENLAESVVHSAYDAELRRARRAEPGRYGFEVHAAAVYQRSYLVKVAGTTVVLYHVPVSRIPEMAVLHFPRERVVFATTFPGLGRVPFSFGTFTPGEALAWIDTLAPLGFDTLLLGDGRTVSRAQFDELASYLAGVRGAVAAGVRQGRALAEIRASTTLDRFRESPHYAARASQVSDLYAAVESSGVQVSVGGVASYGRLWSAFCESRTSCEGGGAVSAARFSLSAHGRRGLGISAEVTLSGQAWSARRSTSVDEEAATRRSRGALLVRWAPRRQGFSYALVGGGSLTIEDVEGLDRVKGALLPKGGSHPIEQRNYWRGVTAGADVERRIGRGLTVRVPVRVTRVFHGSGSAYSDSVLDVQAGVEVAFTLSHRVSFR